MINKKVLLIINTPASCRISLYNLLNKRIKEFRVLFMSDEGLGASKDKIKFDYEILEKSKIVRSAEKKLFGGMPQSHFNKKSFRKIRDFNPDVVISGGGIVNTSNISAYLYCLFFRKKLVIWEAMNFKFSSKVSFMSKILRRAFYKKASSFVAYSSSTKEFLESYGVHPKRIYIGPNTINIKDFVADKKDNNIFLYVGRFSQEKNILFMLNSFKQKFNKSYKLILIGDGEQKKEIKEFIKNNKLEKNIILKGFVNYNLIKDYYKHADFLILPSIWECWGLVTNEAIGSETIPIISNACGSSELIINNVTGFKFSPYDIDKYKKLMKQIIESDIDKERIRKNLRVLKKDLTIENYVKSFENAIKEDRLKKININKKHKKK